MSEYIISKYMNYIDNNNHILIYFEPYNCTEHFGFHPSLATTCGSPGHIGNVLIFEVKDDNTFEISKN